MTEIRPNTICKFRLFLFKSTVKRGSPIQTNLISLPPLGKGELGVLDSKKPSATIHINEANLSGTLDGRLDLLEALKKSQIRFAGSLLALSKLRFLLQFQ